LPTRLLYDVAAFQSYMVAAKWEELQIPITDILESVQIIKITRESTIALQKEIDGPARYSFYSDACFTCSNILQQLTTMKISQIFHLRHRFERFLPDALPWLAISALGLLLVIIASPVMDVFPNFIAKQASNNSEALSFLALAIALTHGESFVAAAIIAVWLFLPPLHQRPALLILALIVMVVASQILTPSGPFAFFNKFMTKNAEAAGMIIVFVALTTWVDPPVLRPIPRRRCRLFSG